VVAYLGGSDTNYTIFVKMFEKFKKNLMKKNKDFGWKIGNIF